MGKIGFLFPGQGAQSVGMGKEVYEKFDSARKLFDDADRILGYALSKICFEGPEEILTRTLNAQPALFVTALAHLEVLRSKFPELKPNLVAGLSLGEFTALAAAHSFSFEEGLKLVRVRAQAMEEAAEKNPGTMASVLGLDQHACEKVAKDSGAQLANLNSPDQFVLSGTEEAISMAVEAAEKSGAKRVIRLKVSGAFHSSLMQPARTRLLEALKGIALNKPDCMFIPNVSGKEESQPERIRELLGDQLTHPVQWIRTVQYAAGQGVRRFIEIGSGRVLKSLAKRIDPGLQVLPFEKIADLEAIETAPEKV